MAFRSERLKKGLIVREVIISDSATLLTLMRQINSNYYYRFVILDKNYKKVAVIDEAKLETLLAKNHAETDISVVLKNDCRVMPDIGQ